MASVSSFFATKAHIEHGLGSWACNQQKQNLFHILKRDMMILFLFLFLHIVHRIDQCGKKEPRYS